MAYTFEQLTEAMNKNHSSRQDFIKHILTIAAAMLAILASFHTATKTDSIEILYFCALSLLSTGIMTGGITLYFDTVGAKSVYLQIKAEIQKQLKDPKHIPGNILYNPPKLFFICEKICYITLLLSIPALAFYSIFK